MTKTNNTKGTQAHSKEEMIAAINKLGESINHSNKMLGQISEGDDGKMSTEEKLLAAIFHTDGSLPTPDDAEYGHIVELLGKIGRKYTPGVHVTVGDLTKLGREYARRVLSGAEGTTVWDSGKTFRWKCSRKYSPDIIFEVDDDVPLCIDFQGWFTAAINYDTAREVLPVLGFPTFGDNSSESMTWGKTTKIGENWYFSPTPANKAEVILLGVTWGGAHSTSRGQNFGKNEVLPNGVMFFQKCASKGGGEGVDFYLVEVTSGSVLQEALIRAEEELLKGDVDEEMRFFQAYSLIQSLDIRYDELDQELASAKEKTQVLYDKINNQVYEDTKDDADAFITHGFMPNKLPEVITRSYDYKSSLKELMQAVADTYTIQENLIRTVDQSEIRAKRYRKLAPKFAKLCGVVMHKCHGWMELNGNVVEVWLPNNEEAEPELVEHRFGFTEGHLQKCLKLIRARIDHDAKTSTQNDAALKKLIEMP